MEELSSTVVLPIIAAVTALGALIWSNTRSSRRVRRALERADARARSIHRH